MNRIINSLRADAGVSALLSDFIYLDQASDRNGYPYLVISMQNEKSGMTLSGPNGTDQGMYDFDLYTKSKRQRGQIMTALRAWGKANNSKPEIRVIERNRRTGYDNTREASHGLVEFSIWLRN